MCHNSNCVLSHSFEAYFSQRSLLLHHVCWCIAWCVIWLHRTIRNRYLHWLNWVQCVFACYIRTRCVQSGKRNSTVEIIPTGSVNTANKPQNRHFLYSMSSYHWPIHTSRVAVNTNNKQNINGKSSALVAYIHTCAHRIWCFLRLTIILLLYIFSRSFHFVFALFLFVFNLLLCVYFFSFIVSIPVKFFSLSALELSTICHFVLFFMEICDYDNLLIWWKW